MTLPIGEGVREQFRGNSLQRTPNHPTPPQESKFSFVHKKFTIENEKTPVKSLQFMGDCVIIVKVSES